MTLGWYCFFVVLGVGLSGCSTNPMCIRDSDSSPIQSESFTGSRVFTNEGERAALPMRVTLSGLPELWPADGAITGGGFSMQLGFAYDGVPADGSVEMPTLVVSFEHADGGGATPSYPTAFGAPFSASSFHACASPEDKGCCEFGAQTCAIDDTVMIERIQGEPFPPLEVTWELGASATVNDCPLAESNPELTLELSTP